jgi:hypothetical protein
MPSAAQELAVPHPAGGGAGFVGEWRRLRRLDLRGNHLCRIPVRPDRGNFGTSSACAWAVAPRGEVVRAPPRARPAP